MIEISWSLEAEKLDGKKDDLEWHKDKSESKQCDWNWEAERR